MKIYKQLLKALKDEINAYKKLYDLLENEVDYITLFDRKNLQFNNAKKQNILERLAKLNDKRVFFVKAIVEKANIQGEVTLKKLVEHVPQDFRQEYEECRKNFIELIKMVREKNAFNQEYLTLSIRRLKTVSNNLHRYLNEASTYDQQGKHNSKAQSSILSKEV